MFPPYVVWLLAVGNPICSPVVKTNKWNVGISNATKWVISLKISSINSSSSMTGHSSLSRTSECYLLALTTSYTGHPGFQWPWFGGTSMFLYCSSLSLNSVIDHVGMGYAYQSSNPLPHRTYEYSCFGENTSGWSTSTTPAFDHLAQSSLFILCHLGGDW